MGAMMNSKELGAALVVLLYDYVLCLPAEVTHIWSSPWNLGKVLYLLTKYLALVDIPLAVAYTYAWEITPATCKLLFGWSCWSFVVGIFVSCVILAMRTWVIWHSTRVGAIIIGAALAGAWLPMFVALAHVFVFNQYFPDPNVIIRGCVIDNSTDRSNMGVVYCLLTTYELCILTLTLAKGVRYIFKKKQVLINTLYTDALMFSLCTSSLGFMIVIIIFVASPEYTYVISPLHRSIHAILSSRIILHLREINARMEGLSPSSLLDSGLGGQPLVSARCKQPVASTDDQDARMSEDTV